MEDERSIEGYSQLLGIEDFEVDEGKVKVHLKTGPQHANMGGWVHGGVMTGLLDFALGVAVVASLQGEEWTATQSLTTDFLRPGKPGETLTARARVDRRGKLAAFASGEIVDARGEVCARATGVWAVRT